MRGSSVNFALISCRNNPSPRWVSVPSLTLEAAPSISVTTLKYQVTLYAAEVDRDALFVSSRLQNGSWSAACADRGSDYAESQ